MYVQLVVNQILIIIMILYKSIITTNIIILSIQRADIHPINDTAHDYDYEFYYNNLIAYITEQPEYSY